MHDTWRQAGPVLLSMLVIVVVAIVRDHSRTAAAITATMPITIPLSLWIIYSGSRGEAAAVRQFTDTLPAGILGTVAFIAAVWLGARAGWRLLPMLGAGYAAWAVVLGLGLWLRQIIR
jgi:hypothetical protein